MYAAPTSSSPDSKAIKKVSNMKIEAEMPVIIAEFLGNYPDAVERLIEFLNEMVINIFNTHPKSITAPHKGSQAEKLIT